LAVLRLLRVGRLLLVSIRLLLSIRRLLAVGLLLAMRRSLLSVLGLAVRWLLWRPVPGTTVTLRRRYAVVLRGRLAMSRVSSGWRSVGLITAAGRTATLIVATGWRSGWLAVVGVLGVWRAGWLEAASRRNGRGRKIVVGGVSVAALHRVHVSTANLRPQGARHFPMASLLKHVVGVVRMPVITGASVRLGLRLFEDMVLAVFDRLRRKKTLQLITARVLVGPVLHRLEHFPLDLDVVVAQGRVVESAENIIHYFVHGDIRILESIQDSRHSVLQDSRSDATSRRVKNVGEMIL
jgi:hypothetical protein